MQLHVVANEGPLARLRLTGRITQEDLKPGEDLMAAALGSDPYAKRVLMNLQETEFIDSSGVGWLMNCHKRFREANGKLVLHSMPPLIRKTLQLLRMEMVLNLAKDEVEATAMAQSQ